MLLNEDLSSPARVHASALDWVPSPLGGVERRMLFRIGDEKARATSIVRYAPGSHFSAHNHPGGEEFLVLEGTFQDENGDYPAGSYVRNPPGSRHTPRSDGGCIIFVKLWQFRADDLEPVVRRPREGERAPLRPGIVAARLLFEGADERVLLEEWQPGAEVALEGFPGLELLVLDGRFSDGTDDLDRYTWLRLPAGESLKARVGPEGARVWYKVAPLMHERVCAFDE
ncbi:cupin [Marinobacter sp. R17]|uniref:cupin domain-containing protein n=1 Tax=Marinobacter sp. R17 TaxID=2484250 RepID=UPI000F4B81F2|nr:cupin domain-containing protein [Marinobacter sp. R17]ROT94518.1 cupin [Marinobacter sp. R17]